MDMGRWKWNWLSGASRAERRESNGLAESGLCKWTMISTATSVVAFVVNWLSSASFRGPADLNAGWSGPQNYSDNRVHNVQDSSEFTLKMMRTAMGRRRLIAGVASTVVDENNL